MRKLFNHLLLDLLALQDGTVMKKTAVIVGKRFIYLMRTGAMDTFGCYLYSMSMILFT